MPVTFLYRLSTALLVVETGPAAGPYDSGGVYAPERQGCLLLETEGGDELANQPRGEPWKDVCRLQPCRALESSSGVATGTR